MTETTTTAAAGEQLPAGAVDVAVTLGEIDGRTVVVAAFATHGITSQLQLPPISAAQVALALLTGAQAAGLDVAPLLDQLAGDTRAKILHPSLGDTARIAGARHG